MSMFAQILSPGAESLRIRRSLSLTLPVSLLAGFLAEDGLPGSVAGFVPLILLAVLAIWQHRHGWNAMSILLVTLASGAGAAIFMEPGPLNLAVTWTLLGCLSLNPHRGDVAHL